MTNRMLEQLKEWKKEGKHDVRVKLATGEVSEGLLLDFDSKDVLLRVFNCNHEELEICRNWVQVSGVITQRND